MSTVVVLRNSSPTAIPGEDLGPVPRYPHELAALRSKPKIGSLTVSTQIEILKSLHTPESDGTSIFQESPAPTEYVPLNSHNSIPSIEDQNQYSAASATTTPILSKCYPHGAITNDSGQNPQTSSPVETAVTRKDHIARLSVNWEELTSDEKEQCRGPQCPSLRLGKSAWFVVGPLRDSYYSGLGRLIKRLVDANHRKIFQRSKSGLNFSPVLLSTSSDITEAEPVILILTGDAKLGQRAQNIIMRSSQYSKHNLGFKIEVDVNTVLHPSDDGVSSANISYVSGHTRPKSICSRPAFVHQLPLGVVNDAKGSRWTRTTIGGVLRVKDCYFAIIVAHCLLGDTDIYPGLFDNDDDDMSEDDGEFVDVGSLDENFEDHPHCKSFAFEPMARDFAVYLDGADTVSSRLDSTTRIPVDMTPLRPILLGRISASNTDGYHGMLKSSVSFDNDWALVPVTNPEFQQPNWFSIPNEDPVLVNRIGRKSQKLSSIVYVGAGTSGSQKATIIETKSCYAFPWTRKVHEVFTIDTAVEPGHSGAWIFDSNGYLYGIVVATAPDLSLTYALYAEDLFTDMMPLSSGGIEMHELLPQVSDCDTKRVPKGISFALKDISSTLRDVSYASQSISYASQGISYASQGISFYSGDVSYISKDIFSTSDDRILVSQEKMPLTTEKWQSTVNKQIQHRPPRPELSGRQLLMMGSTLMLITFSHSFDAFVLYNTLPSITNYFNMVVDIGWYVSAYWICVSVLQFPFKRISEELGSMPMCLGSVLTFELGCFVSGFAKTSSAFVAGRALAGAGSCGMMASVLQIVRQQIVASQRDRLMALVGLAFFVGQILGFLIGAAIAQYKTWQWCFWINPPMGAIGICGLLLLRTYNIPGMQCRKLHRFFSCLGIVGFVIFTSSCVVFLFWLLSARINPSWNASKTIGLIVGSTAAACSALIWSACWMKRNSGLRVGKQWAILVCCNRMMIALESGSTMVVVCYLSLWFQAIKRAPALDSAVSVLPIVGTAVVVRVVVNALRPYLLKFAPKWLVASALIGSILQLAGTILIRTLHQAADAGQSIGYQFLIGIGSGLRHDWIFAGSIISAAEAGSMVVVGVRMMMIHAFGAAIFLATAQTIFIGSLKTIVLESTPGINGTTIILHGATNFLQLAGNNTSVKQALLSKYDDAISNAFFVAVGCSAAECLVAFIVCFIVLSI